MRLRIERIEAMASERPPGYVEAVLAAGAVEGEWLEISSEALAELRARFRPARTEPPLPGMGTMIRSAVSAAGAEISARVRGMAELTQEEVDRRLGMCSSPGSCDQFRESDRRCAMCGCFVDLKAQARSQVCPAGKW